MLGSRFAEAVAGLLGGSLRSLPADNAFAVVVPGGRMPVLVRELGHVRTISLAGRCAWTSKAPQIEPALGAELVAACKRWSEEPEAPLTIWEIGVELVQTVSEALGERWTMRIPGPPLPREARLHPPDHAAGSIGIFEGRVFVWAEGEEPCDFPASTRGELLACMDDVVAAARRQRGQHARNVSLSERASELAQGLAARFEAEFGHDARVTTWRRPTHGTGISVTISCAGAETLLEVEGDTIGVHAGLVGGDGWHATMTSVDDGIDGIVAAMRLAASSLTLERLVPGRVYRVRETIQELTAGTAVRFERFDDIDNHYGQYVFTSTDGRRLVVSGDFSTPRRSPLAETHRYLEDTEPQPR